MNFPKTYDPYRVDSPPLPKNEDLVRCSECPCPVSIYGGVTCGGRCSDIRRSREHGERRKEKAKEKAKVKYKPRECKSDTCDRKFTPKFGNQWYCLNDKCKAEVKKRKRREYMKDLGL